MNQILAALRSLVLAAAGTVAAVVLVAGVKVSRSSLTGYDVAGRRGLDIVEALHAIEDAAVAAPIPDASTTRIVSPSTSGREALYSATINAIRSLGVRVTIRNAPLMGGFPRLALSCQGDVGCSRDEHVTAASRVVAALHGEGLNAAADGSTVYVLAA